MTIQSVLPPPNEDDEDVHPAPSDPQDPPAAPDELLNPA
jgi:hypothetical protein